MKVKAIINFNDLESNVHRNIGDEFEVSQERANYLLEHNAVEVIEDVKEEINVVIDEEEVKEEVVKPTTEFKKKKKKK